MDRTHDRALIRRLQARDEAAVRELADRYGPRIHQLAIRHLKNREDAEEVTQDVLVKVYRKIGSFRGDAALSSWIYRVTFNTAMSRLRSSRLARQAAQERDRVEAAEAASGMRSFGPSRLREPADWSRLPDDDLLRMELRERVATAILDLPAIYRAPVILRDIQGLTTEEASHRLHVKGQTLKSRLHRGRLLLRERLSLFATGLMLHRPTPAPAYSA